MNKVVYILVFVGAFIATTVGISFLNSKFNNIFQFDFSPPQEAADSLSVNMDNQILTDESLKGENNLGVLDENRLSENIMNNKILRDSLQILKNQVEQLKNNSLQDIQTSEEEDLTRSKKEYNNWIKKTADLFASMDPKKAAKIIQNYSDNIARDIIYSMNKKKAAEILAELNPDIVTRIINVD